MPGVVFQEHLADRLAEVPEESLGHFQTVDHQAVERRQIGQQVITAAATELVAEAGGPVSRARLPTVHVGRDQRLAGQRPDVRRQLSDHRGELGLDGRLAQLVAFQARGLGLRRSRAAAGHRMSDPQDEPAPGRHVPFQPSVRVHPARQILDFGRRDALRAGNDRPLRVGGNRPGPRHAAGEILVAGKRLGRVEILDPAELARRRPPRARGRPARRCRDRSFQSSAAGPIPRRSGPDLG